MSWDICSTLEDMQLSGERLTPEHVDEAVERVYLREFDRAPVDHVRTLVRSDPNLRDALMSVHYGKASTLDDAVRSRLFLAGITKAGGAAPEFNNRIIAEALSTEWLNQVADSHDNPLEIADRLYGERDYSGVVGLFEKFIVTDSDGHHLLDRVRSMQFGIALYHLNRLEEAQRYLEQARTAPGLPELRATILFYLASAKLRSGDADASIVMFEEVAAQPGEFEYLARLALAGALVTASARTHAPRIIELTQSIVAREPMTDDDASNELTASALYNQAVAQLAAGDRAPAQAALERALAVAPSDLVPGIYLRLIDVLEDSSRQHDALSHVVNLLERSLPMARRYGATALSFSNFTLGALVAKALQIGATGAAERLLSLAKKSMGEESAGRIAVRILLSAGTEHGYLALHPLIEAGLASADEDRLSPSDTLTLAKAAVMSGATSDKAGVFERYCRLIELHRTSFVFEEADGLICVGQVTLGINTNDHVLLHQVMAFFDRLREPFMGAQPFLYTFYLNQKINYYKHRQQQSEAQKFAQEIVNVFEDADTVNLDAFDPAIRSFMEQVHVNARATLAALAPDRFRKLGRNQIVKYRHARTGQVKIAKFKKVEDELRSGAFELVAPKLEGES